MQKLAFVLGFGASSLIAAAALADTASEARFFDAVARRAYGAGQYEKALESFQLVQEIAPSHRQLYNIALCADLAGRGDMAFSLYNEYLRSDDPDVSRRAEAERRAERLKSKLALVEITSEPPGAMVYVDRKELGQFGVTPLTLAVSDGEHHLLLERQGFAPAAVHVTAKTGALAPVSALLTPEFGRLVVNVTPGLATLRFLRDDTEVPARLERGGYRLQVGRYRVLASAPGYAPTEGRVVVSEDATAQLDVGLVPLSRVTGTLLVSTGTVAAEVFIDGRRVAVTPAMLREVAAGKHLLELRVGSRVSRRSITVVSGRSTLVEVELGAGAP